MPIQKKVKIADALEVLNRAVEADREAMAALRGAKVPCNEKLAKDPTIQCGMERVPGSVHDVWEEDDPVEVGGRDVYNVGFLGILNGIFGVDDRTGYGPIAAVFEVLCANCKLDPQKDKVRVGDPCPHCGVALKLGPLRKFIAVDQSKLPTLER